MSYYGMGAAAGSFGVHGGRQRRELLQQYNYGNNGYMLASQAYSTQPSEDVQMMREKARDVRMMQEKYNQERARYTVVKNKVLTTELELARTQEKLRQYQKVGEQSLESAPDSEQSCQLCFERAKNATFSCGHMCCYECGLQTLDSIGSCAFCKKRGVTVIRLYNL